MSDESSPGSPQSRLLQLEHALGFLGRQTAGQTHELTNVLNIINELTGLVDDLVQVSASTGQVSPERIRESLQKIQTQIQRGEDLLRELNRLAHSVDELCCRFTWRELLERVEGLAQRPLRLHRATLELVPPQPDTALEGPLIAYQQALLGALTTALQCGEDVRSVRLTGEASGDIITVGVESDATASAAPPEGVAGGASSPPTLAELVSYLGGTVTALPRPGDPIRIVMTLPCG